MTFVKVRCPDSQMPPQEDFFDIGWVMSVSPAPSETELNWQAPVLYWVHSMPLVCEQWMQPVETSQCYESNLVKFVVYGAERLSSG